MAEKESVTPFNAKDFAQAIRDDKPAFYTHDGKEENPHGREIPQDISEDELGESQLGGSTTDQDADDDTTKSAKEIGYDEKDDPQKKHDNE